jgi:hypothetical protein
MVSRRTKLTVRAILSRPTRATPGSTPLFETGVLKQVDGQWSLDATEDDSVLESLLGLTLAQDGLQSF